ncbi:hypothetical protein [Bradyrhizobium sp. USDA 4452]
MSTQLLERNKSVRAKPNNPIFCADRSWDQRAETGFMKQIEDAFQAAVGTLLEGKAASVSAEARPAIDRMYSLWYWRARYRDLESQEIELKGIVGSVLTLEQEENLAREQRVHVRPSKWEDAGAPDERRDVDDPHKPLRRSARNRRAEMERHRPADRDCFDGFDLTVGSLI